MNINTIVRNSNVTKILDSTKGGCEVLNFKISEIKKKKHFIVILVTKTWPFETSLLSRLLSCG
jgi:hypothetical protein